MASAWWTYSGSIPRPASAARIRGSSQSGRGAVWAARAGSARDGPRRRRTTARRAALRGRPRRTLARSDASAMPPKSNRCAKRRESSAPSRTRVPASLSRRRDLTAPGVAASLGRRWSSPATWIPSSSTPASDRSLPGRRRDPIRSPASRAPTWVACRSPGSPAAGWPGPSLRSSRSGSSASSPDRSADVAAASDRAAHARDQNIGLASEVSDLRREMALVQRQSFVEQEARAYGLGTRGERPFTLAAGHPTARGRCARIGRGPTRRPSRAHVAARRLARAPVRARAADPTPRVEAGLPPTERPPRSRPGRPPDRLPDNPRSGLTLVRRGGYARPKTVMKTISLNASMRDRRTRGAT